MDRRVSITFLLTAVQKKQEFKWKKYLKDSRPNIPYKSTFYKTIKFLCKLKF